jgi:hypothetical protein
MAKKSMKDKRRDRLEKERLTLKRQIERDESLLDSEEEFVEEDAEEAVEKNMGSVEAAPMSAYGGPTSWGELESAREMQAKNQKVQEASYTVQDLVYNIVNHPMLSTDEKANAIKAVGDEFGSRVASIMDQPIQKELDMDLLEVEAMIAKDLRATPLAERIGSWISKAVSAGDNNKLTDKNHVRNALARTANMLKIGGQSALDAKAALPSIREAAKKFGIGSVEKSVSSVVVEKDASGSWRAVMWPSNNFKDWDGEIISEKAHTEYVEWVNQNMDLAPVFTTWHKPDMVRKNQVDFVAYENGFLMMSAPLTEPEAAGLLKAQALTSLGMSHGSLVFERDPQDSRVINKYRMVEVSDLPLENAANPFTDFTILTKEADMDTLKYLTAMLGSEEKAKAILGKTEDKQKVLKDAGIENKEKVEEPVVEPVKEPVAPPDPAAPSTDDIVAKVLKELDIEGLQEFLGKAQESMEKVPVLEGLVKDLSGNREDWLAEQISPKAEKKFLWSRASTDEKTVVKEGEPEDEKLKSAVAGLPEDWLSEALGVSPL